MNKSSRTKVKILTL